MRKKKRNNIQQTNLLSDINLPSDVKKLSVDELPFLCGEIREFLISTLSKHPGHFASSMGAVELTVALHYVFNTPYDKIVWDVGHQAYAHKILTGRKGRFDTLRQLNGLSGFPTPSESEYDSFSAGHASNSISAALGMAVASLLKKETPRRNVVAVIGDAAISGGLAFEGLNNATNTRNNLLIILNDNDMSIDKNVGSLNSYLTHLTTSKSYNTIRYKTYKALKRLHLISEKRRGTILRFNNSLKSLLGRQQNIFEGLNIRYFGPFDGHDIKRLVRVLSDIKDMEGPRILHIRTKKGKGYSPAENNPAIWHAPGRFEPDTGRCSVSATKLTSKTPGPFKYQDVFGLTMVELARENKDVVGITAAMPSGTSMSYLMNEMPERVFDVGISEGHAVTFAGGLASDGFKPFVAIYSSFLQRGFDHIIHDVAIQKLPVVFCVDRSGIVGEDGATHHGLFDLAYLRIIPNIVVSAPSDEHQLRNLLYTATKYQSGPFAIRYPRGKGYLKQWHNEPKLIDIGKGQKIEDGDDAVILSVGTISNEVKKARTILAQKQLSVAHYDMIFVKPLDTQILDEIKELNRPIITIEDGVVAGGFGSAVKEYLSDTGLEILSLGIPDIFPTHGTPDELYKICGLDAQSISEKINKFVNEKRSAR